jgi:hypothetical protein
VDERQFVVDLMRALPEAFDDSYLDDEPLPYAALGSARSWIEDHAIAISGIWRRRLHARVKPTGADAFARFWDFVEAQALASRHDADLRTLLQIECFEGVGWVEDVIEHLGPETRELLLDAQQWLSIYNDQVGRWASRRRRKNP